MNTITKRRKKLLIKEIKTTKALIKFVEKGYGKDKCKSYAVGCPNCEGQIFLGYLYDHLELLKLELED